MYKKIALFSSLILFVFSQSCSPTPAITPVAVDSQPVLEQPEPDTFQILSPAISPVSWRYKGASLAGYWHDSYAQPNAFDTVDYLSGLGVSHVALIVSWYQDNMQSTEIYPRYEKETATDESLREIIRYIHSKSMGVMLKPHLEPDQDWLSLACTEEGSRCWRGVIDPSDHAKWFESYGDFILHYARMAEDEGVELFSIGTEMPSMTKAQEDQARWAALAQEVRQVYHQKLLYSAHEYEIMGGYYEIEDTPVKYEFPPLPVSFWVPFDYAGTTVYYTIQNLDNSNSPAPSAEALLKNWAENPARHESQNRLLEAFETWASEHGKPVIFSEIGYRSVDYAALNPYNTRGPNLPGLTDGFNEIAQANAYLAAFQAVGNADWLAGVFWWQFIPNAANRRECAEDVDPALEEEASYTPCGKQAARILQEWYQGTEMRLPPAYTPSLPDLLNLSILNQQELERRWRAQTSGELTFNLDQAVSFDGGAGSLHLVSNLSCGEGRYSQLDYLFSTEQDFSQYRSLSLTAKLAEPEQHGELSISLLESDGTEWQATNWLAGDQWREFKIGLRAGSAERDDPWAHPTEFVVSNWFEPDEHNPVFAPYQLDLSQIAGIRIKIMTVNSDCASLPEIEAWVGKLELSKEEVIPAVPTRLPVLDTFDYASQTDLEKNWQVIKSDVASLNFSLDVGQANPSLAISTDLPCGEPRYAFLIRRFPRLLDFSSYRVLEFRARGDRIDAEPWGGELSIVLWDTNGNSEELWQSTRWLNRKDDWQQIDIPLIGNGQFDPWKQNGFSIPPWENLIDGLFDLTQIAGMGIKLNTTDGVCQKYPTMQGWIDDLILR